MSPLKPPLGSRQPRRSSLALVGCIVAGSVLRIWWNDVTRFSPADETHYLSLARWLSGGFFQRYPEVTRWFIETPRAHDSPPLLRFGHFGLITAACKLATVCEGHTLATLSTLGGIASLVLTWLVGRELLGERTAVVATALTVTSPLQLALGRRALQDELVCAAMLATLWLLLRALRAPLETGKGVPWRHLAVVGVATFALAEKETLLLLVPSSFALWLLARPERGKQPRDWLFLLPPVLYFLGNVALEGNASDFFQMARISASSIQNSAYATQYQGGPPHLVLLGLFLLAPVGFLLATAAAALPAIPTPEGQGARWLTVFTLTAVLTFALFSKNIRYFVIGDALLRLMAAHFLVQRAPRRHAGPWTLGWVLASCGTELWIFHQVFLEAGIYDPTSFDLLSALGALPRP